MAYLILPSRRTRQPQGAVRVTSVYEENLIGLATPIQSFRQTLTRDSGSSGLGAASGGIGWRFNSGAADIAINSDAAPDKSVGYPLTGVAFGRILGASGSGFHTFLSLDNTTSHGCRIMLRDSTSGVHVQALGGGGVGTCTGGTWAQNSDVSVAAVFRSATNRQAYLHGRSTAAAETTNIGATTNLNQFVIGGYKGSVTAYVPNGLVYIGGWWSRVFSDAELAEFARYPFMALAPDPRRIYFGAGATGGGGPETIPLTKVSLGWSPQSTTTNAKESLPLTKVSFGWTAKTLGVSASSVIALTKASLGWTAKTLNTNAKSVIGVTKASIGWTAKTLTSTGSDIVVMTKASLGWTAKTISTNAITVAGLTKASFAITAKTLTVNAKEGLALVRASFGWTGQNNTTNQDVFVPSTDTNRPSHLRRFIGRR